MSGPVVLVMGTPCSGKSTYIRENFPASVDLEILDEKSLKNLGRILRYLNAVFYEGKSAIIEGVFSDRQRRRRLVEFVLDRNHQIESRFLDTPLEICLERNQERDPKLRSSPAKIRKISKEISIPDFFEGFARIEIIRGNQRW